MPPAPPRPSLRRRPLVAALALVGVVSALAACTSVVEGGPSTGVLPISVAPPVDAGTVTLRADYDRTVHEVNTYWTDDRLTDAAPHDPIAPPDRGATPADTSTGVIVDPSTGAVNPAGSQTAPTSAGDAFPAPGLSAATQGRLYMTVGGQDMVCSATVVTSAGRDLVVTAAHCLWDTVNDVMADYVVFVPADANNAQVAPYGIWPADSWVLPTAFSESAEEVDHQISGDGWAYDFAFVSLAPNDQGQAIQDVTGGQGVAFGIPAQELLVTGYPSAPPFDGLSQRYCAADDWEPFAYAYRIPCVMTPGMSGGGWLTNFDPVTGSGYVVGASSFLNGTMIGAAPFGATALALYTEMGGV